MLFDKSTILRSLIFELCYTNGIYEPMLRQASSDLPIIDADIRDSDQTWASVLFLMWCINRQQKQACMPLLQHNICSHTGWERSLLSLVKVAERFWCLTEMNFVKWVFKQIRLLVYFNPIEIFTVKLLINIWMKNSIQYDVSVQVLTWKCLYFYSFRVFLFSEGSDMPRGCPQFCVAAGSQKLLPYNILSF